MDRYIEFIFNHYILVLAFAVVTYLLVQEIIDSIVNKARHISPLSLVAKMNNEEVVIIDVREAPEFVDSHIEQAINIPLSKFKDELPKLEQYKTKPVIITCQNGARSASAGRQLTKAGFNKIYSLTGGMTAWEEEYKLPVKLKNKKKN